MASARRTGTNEQVATGGNNSRTYDFDAGGFGTWEAATDTNHVSDNESDVLECYDDAASFDDSATLDGSTNDATRFRIVRPAAGEGHDGTSNNGFYFLSVANITIAVVDESFSQLQDLIVTLTNNSSDSRACAQVGSSGTDAKLIACIAFDGLNSGAGGTRGLRIESPSSAQMVLCLAEDNESDNIVLSGTTIHAYNCVSVDAGSQGFRNSATTAVVKNCLSTGSTSNDFEAGTYTGSDYNSAGDATDPDSGANNRVSQTFSFENAGGNDYHITYSDLGAHDFGQDLSADGVFAFDDDIDGTLWDAWDIGFNEPGGPFVRSRALSTEDAGNVTSHTIQLPATIESGDLLLAFFSIDGNPSTSWPNEGTEWNVIFSQTSGGSVKFQCAWKEADGTEDGTTIEVTSGSSERSSHSVLAVGGAEDPDTTPPDNSTPATGNSTSPNPVAVIIATSKDYLFVASTGVDRDRTVTAIPTNYSHENTQAGGGANSSTCSTVERQLTTGTDEDAGAFTISASDQWVAFTVRVHPPGGPVDLPYQPWMQRAPILAQ